MCLHRFRRDRAVDVTVELMRALGLLAEPPSTEHERVADLLGIGARPDASEYTDLFILQLFPYASVYLSADGMLGGGPADRIAGVWRALGHVPPPEPDHLSALLGLYASLSESQASEEGEATRLLIANAGAALLNDHILSWLPVYLKAVEAHASAFYGAWAGMLADTLRQAAQRTDYAAASNPHLACVSCLPDPRKAGGEIFLEGLLTPAQCGLVLSRQDLIDAARALGLGSRIGERRYQLRALLSQDAERVLAWLGTESGHWADWHSNESWAPAPARTHWLARSSHTRDLIGSLLAEGWDDAGPD